MFTISTSWADSKSVMLYCLQVAKKNHHHQKKKRKSKQKQIGTTEQLTKNNGGELNI